MEPDYPAAHSMAVTWFAVDAVGHVAIFEAGLSGHAPEGVYVDRRDESAPIYAGVGQEGDLRWPERMMQKEQAMEPDYPAAHSMDTTFFAVDAGGHVALFDTDEEGHVPKGANNDIESELWDLRKPPGADEEDGWDTYVLCNTVGLYYFDYENQVIPIGVYFLVQVPESPLHVDQLPPELRQRCRSIQFDVRFDQIEQLQPLEFIPCDFWNQESDAYLCGDGKTVKPVPGRESHFARFVRRCRGELAAWTKDLVFEGPMEPE
jgi:hypothetical protein